MKYIIMKKTTSIKGITQIFNNRNFIKLAKNYLIYFAFTAIYIFYSTTGISQIQINTGGSAYGYMLNKDKTVNDNSGNNESYKTFNYNGSKYFSIGLGYKNDKNFYFGIESSLHKYTLEHANEYYYTNPDYWTPQQNNYTSSIYSYRIGIECAYNFMPDKKLRPVISIAAHSANEFHSYTEGVDIYTRGDEIKKEPFSEDSKTSTSAFYFNFRLGGSYHINEHFAVSMALELSAGLSSFTEYYSYVETPTRYELAIPISLHYNF